MKCPECHKAFGYEEDDANNYLCDECVEVSRRRQSWAYISVGTYIALLMLASCASWNAANQAAKMVDNSIASRIERSSNEIENLNRELAECKKKSNCSDKERYELQRRLDERLKKSVRNLKKEAKKLKNTVHSNGAD